MVWKNKATYQTQGIPYLIPKRLSTSSAHTIYREWRSPFSHQSFPIRNRFANHRPWSIGTTLLDFLRLTCFWLVLDTTIMLYFFMADVHWSFLSLTKSIQTWPLIYTEHGEVPTSRLMGCWYRCQWLLNFSWWRWWCPKPMADPALWFSPVKHATLSH